jgi:hypothetical protein
MTLNDFLKPVVEMPSRLQPGALRLKPLKMQRPVIHATDCPL